MAEPVSSHEYLRQQGTTFVVFHPCAEQLVLGLGCSEQPAVVPHCVAYRRQEVGGDQGRSNQLAPELWPHQQAYEALLQVQRLLHLPAPPQPPGQQQQQQKQQEDAEGAADPFPAAKAGLVSQKEGAEGSDGFIWLDEKQQEKLLQQRRSQQQQLQQQGAQKQSVVQPAQAKQKLPCFAGGQVPALWPPDAYEAHWLMTPDNHIAGLDTTPQHILLDRFEAVWGWALQQLGLPLARCRHLSAVLAVPIDMTAAEVRFLADLLLGRLGFAALVVHLEPVAATFGNGTTSACVVSIGSSSCTVCCIDDAVVLAPVNSRFTLPVGLVDVAGALAGWMSCYGHWPAQLQQRGIGFRALSGAAEPAQAAEGLQQAADGAADVAKKGVPAGQGAALSPASVYNMLLLEDLVLQQCYFPKENYQPGLLGQPMLEDQPPAVVPVRIPGQPTTNYNVSLGSWAAAASMSLFYPELAPTGLSSESCHPAAAQQGHAGSPAQPASIKQEAADGAGSGPPPPAAAAAGAASGGGDGRAGGSAGSDALYRRCHGCVLDLPAAEALHLQSQLKARLEAGEAGAPPDGMYILPLELTDKPVGANAAGAAAGSGPAGGTPTPGSILQPAASAGAASSGQGPEAPEVKSPPAAGRNGPGGGSRGTPGAAGGASIGLDEAVFKSIMATSSGRPELMARLAAGLLLVGPGGGLRGLAQMLERRLGQRLTAAGPPQVVSCLEPRAEPAHVAWKGAALLAALDAGRENWLPRHQWVDGGMVLPAPPAAKGTTGAAAAAAAAASKKAAGAGAAAAGAGPVGAGAGSGGATGSGSNSTAAAGRHTKLFYYCRTEQGML